MASGSVRPLFITCFICKERTTRINFISHLLNEHSAKYGELLNDYIHSLTVPATISLYNCRSCGNSFVQRREYTKHKIICSDNIFDNKNYSKMYGEGYTNRLFDIDHSIIDMIKVEKEDFKAGIYSFKVSHEENESIEKRFYDYTFAEEMLSAIYNEMLKTFCGSPSYTCP